MCDRIAIVYKGQDRRPGHHGPSCGEQTASAAMSLEDLFLKLTGGPREHQLDAVLEALRWRPRLLSRGSGRSSPPSGAACSRVSARSAAGRWAKLLLLSVVGGALLDRDLRRRLPGAAAISSGWTTSATCSPARCSASSCWRFLSILLLSNIITALSHLLPGQGPRPPGRGAGRRRPALSRQADARRWSTRRGWWRCSRCRSSPPTGSCTRAGRCSRSSRWRRSCRTW